jgi:hypothetical protein
MGEASSSPEDSEHKPVRGDQAVGKRVIRLKKAEVFIDGEKRLIVMIRDMTDSIEVERIQIKLREENARQIMINKEFNDVFESHSRAIDEA